MPTQQIGPKRFTTIFLAITRPLLYSRRMAKTDREKIRDAIAIQAVEYEEAGQCIIVQGGPKYRFFDDGTLKSIRIGDSYHYPHSVASRAEGAVTARFQKQGSMATGGDA